MKADSETKESQEKISFNIAQLPHAVLKAFSENALPPSSPDDPRVALNARAWALLTKLGIDCGDGPEVTIQALWKAARSVGFSPEDFSRMSRSDLFCVLEMKALVLERLRHLGLEDPLHTSLIDSINRRPKGASADGRTLRKLRKESKMSQEKFAEKCGVSVDTIQRAESGRAPVSDESLAIIADFLARKLNRDIKLTDLRKKTQ
jgi:DNA-binding transcriptional regulator YiaG